MGKEQLTTEIFLHYSTLDKEYRETVEREFQKAHSALCIATSTLELGIDIGDVDAIVMYGAPASVGSFVQRVGRGNRRSTTSYVYGICRDYHINGMPLGAEHDLILFYALISSMLESEMEGSPNTELYSVYVQQLFSLTHQVYGNSVQPLCLSSRVVERIDHPFVIFDESSGGSFATFSPMVTTLSSKRTLSRQISGKRCGNPLISGATSHPDTT